MLRLNSVRPVLLVGTLLVGAALLPVHLLQAQPVALPRLTLSAGAVDSGTAIVAVQATVGQPVVGSVEGPVVALAFGHWAEPPGAPTNVSVAPLDVPTELRLAPNYPNPFNPSTVIAYTLPAQVEVTLEVFDVFGRRVQTLVKQAQPPGEHAVTFEAGQLASGVYLYRLTAGAQQITRQMLLVK
ncbi:MAG: T9SS type A sorting domain-containing protein [Bacteroidota bacterium]